MQSNPYKDLALEVADLVSEKQLQYGNSFEKAGEILAVLYPTCVSLEQYQDALTILRMIDKLFRIATAHPTDTEEPWKDLNGYSLLGLERSRRKK